MNQSQREAIYELKDRGDSTRTIAKKLGISQSAVSRELRGISKKPKARQHRRIIDGTPCKEIQDELRRQAGKPDWPVPAPPDNPTKWVRFDCPFCKGTRGNTAAINYDAQWFSCFRRSCQVNFGTRGGSMPINDDELYKLLVHFQDQINRAVLKVRRKFGNWVTVRELYSSAAELMWNYAYRPYGGPNDAGKLWEVWEAEAMKMRDPELLYRYVYEAVYKDLLNRADSLTKWKRRHSEREVLLSPMESTDRETGELEENSALDAAISQALNDRPKVVVTVDSMGELTSEGFRAVESGKRLNLPTGCERYRDGLGPRKGHCPTCDRQLRPTAHRMPLEQWLGQHGGMSHWHWDNRPQTGPGRSWVAGAVHTPRGDEHSASIQAPGKADKSLNSNAL